MSMLKAIAVLLGSGLIVAGFILPQIACGLAGGYASCDASPWLTLVVLGIALAAAGVLIEPPRRPERPPHDRWWRPS